MSTPRLGSWGDHLRLTLDNVHRLLHQSAHSYGPSKLASSAFNVDARRPYHAGQLLDPDSVLMFPDKNIKTWSFLTPTQGNENKPGTLIDHAKNHRDLANIKAMKRSC